MLPPIIPIPFFLNPATFATAIRAVGGAGASTLLAYVLVQHLWKHTPEWIREDESWLALFAKSKRATNGKNSTNTSTTLHTGKRLQGHASVDADDIIAESMVGDFVDEMASLTAVVQKLEALVITGYDKLGSRRGLRRRRRAVRRAVDSLRRKDDNVLNDTVDPINGDPVNHDSEEQEIISPLEWHAALLAYWQLSNQIRKHYPSWRDEVYARCHTHTLWQKGDTQQSKRNAFSNDSSTNQTMNSCSNTGSQNNNLTNDYVRNDGYNNDNSVTSSQIKELQSMLQFAIWAYESNEDLLRSFLLSSMIDRGQGSSSENDIHKTKQNNYGYQLILHRTTSYMEPNTTNTATKMRKPPGRVGYFVAVSHFQRTLLIGMKGTSTLEEILTDCCGRAVRVDLDNDPHGYHPTLTPTLSVVADSHDDGSVNDQDADDTVNDNIYPSFRNEDSTEDTINGGYFPEILQDGTHNVDHGEYDKLNVEDFLHVYSIAGDNDNIGACVLPDEGIEVEWLHHARRNNHGHTDTSLVTSLDYNNTYGKRRQGSPLFCSSKSKKPLRQVPSTDNVLLFPSVPTSSSTQNINSQNASSFTSSAQSSTPELDRSLTDECMESNCVEMEANRSHKLRGVHEGILHCAQQLLFEISPLIEEYALSKGYDVVCTGHSLGAGTAILLAVLIRGRYPELTGLFSSSSNGGVCHVQTRCNESGINRGERVRAYAFAPPPVLDRESSLACRHYVVSVINGSDLIPRSSLTNLDSFLTILEAVRGRLVEMGMNPGRSKSASQQETNIIASTIALFCKLCEGTDGDLLLDPTELHLVSEEAIAEASIGDGKEDKFYWDEEFGHHLFAPGRLLLLYEDWSTKEQATLGKAESQDLSDQEGRCNDEHVHAVWTDGTNSVLKRFEIGAGSGMVTDHLTTSYQRSLERCRSQMLNHDI